MELQTRQQENVFVIELSGELMGGSDSEKFRNVIDEAIMDETNNVVIDLERVHWMNSSGLGLLISALTSLRSSGGDLRLANLSERLRRPLTITKLDTIFKEFDSVQSAVQSFN